MYVDTIIDDLAQPFFSLDLPRNLAMERFYGEPVLERLVEHGKETVTTVNQFLEVFEDFEEEGELNLSRVYDSDEEQLDYDPENQKARKE